MVEIDGVEFDDEKNIDLDLEHIVSRAIRRNWYDRINMEEWLKRRGVKSPKMAKTVLILIVIVNLLLSALIMIKFVL